MLPAISYLEAFQVRAILSAFHLSFSQALSALLTCTRCLRELTYKKPNTFIEHVRLLANRSHFGAEWGRISSEQSGILIDSIDSIWFLILLKEFREKLREWIYWEPAWQAFLSKRILDECVFGLMKLNKI